MPHTEVQLTGVDEVFDALRLSNRKQFRQNFVDRWFFRGHGSPNWELKPRVWRDDFLPLIKQLNGVLSYVGGIVMHPCVKSVYGLEVFKTEDRLERAKEVTVRLFAERHLLENFYQVAHDVALLQSPLSRTMTEIFENPNFLYTDPNSNISALPQHHGIPTRLLDWTRDPLTALAFALDGSADNGDIDVWALNVGKLRDDEETNQTSERGPISISEGDNTSNRYLYAQRGAFTYISGAEKEYIEHGRYPALNDKTEGDTLTRFKIKLNIEEKHEAMIMLMKERRTKAHLMPDLSNCASYAIQALRLNTRLEP